jgi:hypothetical protein
MLLFLAAVLEQLDLAQEHVSKGDVHNARFGLMLTDNAVELILHQIAKDKAASLRSWGHLRETYAHQAALDKALEKSFDAKVKFARLEANLSQEAARTIGIMHDYRNELYHAGLQHQSILLGLARFYFDVACGFIRGYRPMGLGWGSNQKMPERAQKYFNSSSFVPGSWEDFAKGCTALASQCGHDAAGTIAALTDHMDEVIEDQDTCIDIVARGVYEGQERTRDHAVIDCQAWPLAFSAKGRAFAAGRGWTGSVLELVQWLADNHPLRFRRDPVPSWRKQAAKLRGTKNPHAALAHYQSFMTETSDLREALDEAARQAEAEIDAAIDRARGK